MLADRGHAGIGKTLDGARAERADRGRIEMQRAIADHAARAVIEIEHRREAEIDAVRRELGPDHVGRRARRVPPLLTVAVPEPPELAHRWNRAEALAKALHAAAFVVDADRQRR